MSFIFRYKKYLLTLSALLIVMLLNYDNITTTIAKSYHHYNLKNNSQDEIYRLSKNERRSLGLPPNQYFEQLWKWSMDPISGRPMFDELHKIQEELNNARSVRQNIVPGESIASKWDERGPNNVGGRTKGALFDPNDTTDETVFSAGISGGLFKNTKISDPNSQWIKIEGIPENLPVTAITYDPNNKQIFYIGSGESYTNQGVGNGLWQSKDGGATWAKIFGGRSGQAGIPFINDVIVRNNSGTSEVYFVSSKGWNWDTGQTLGWNEYGLFKSTDEGVSFSLIDNKISGSNSQYQGIDLEIAPNNKIWMCTTNRGGGGGGGTILVSNNEGTSFEKKYEISGGTRTEMEVASNGHIYVLAATADPVKIIKSTDEFATEPTVITLPDDDDTGISSNDFTRGQSFYDLVIDSDPNNPDHIFVGGIDLFKSTTGAVSSDGSNPWTQISHWYGGFGHQYIHADQHGMVFAPNDSSKKLFLNDGGIYFSKTEADGTETASSRNNNLNTSQIYTLGVAPSEMFKEKADTPIGLRDISQLGQTTITIGGMTDVIITGLQDNGSQLMANNNNAITNGGMASGGDGAASMFSQVNSKPYLITNYVFNQSVDIIDFNTISKKSINDDSEENGDFITTQALDSKKGILYSNFTSR